MGEIEEKRAVLHNPNCYIDIDVDNLLFWSFFCIEYSLFFLIKLYLIPMDFHMAILTKIPCTEGQQIFWFISSTNISGQNVVNLKLYAFVFLKAQLALMIVVELYLLPNNGRN
jgi:hypothetical protein